MNTCYIVFPAILSLLFLWKPTPSLWERAPPHSMCFWGNCWSPNLVHTSHRNYIGHKLSIRSFYPRSHRYWFREVTWSREDPSCKFYGHILRKRLCRNPLSLCADQFSLRSPQDEPRGEHRKERGPRNPKSSDAWGQGPSLFLPVKWVKMCMFRLVLGHWEVKFPDKQENERRASKWSSLMLWKIAQCCCEIAVTSLWNRVIYPLPGVLLIFCQPAFVKQESYFQGCRFFLY